MTSTTEHLLGFDARHAPPASFGKWDASRKAQYLLRQNIVAPLSTDGMVWPSIFTCSERLDSDIEVIGGQNNRRLLIPEWTGSNFGFWDNLDTLYSSLQQNSALISEPFWIVAVTWHRDQAYETHSTVEPYFGPYLFPTIPTDRPKTWILLGYDVSDGSGLSGLTNCGYNASEAELLPSSWADNLNDYHLFEEMEWAFRFATLADGRAPEHSPFCVYGLWLVAKDEEARR